MDLRRPPSAAAAAAAAAAAMLPSQGYSSAATAGTAQSQSMPTEYGNDPSTLVSAYDASSCLRGESGNAHHQGGAGGRQPLQESTGNAQHHQHHHQQQHHQHHHQHHYYPQGQHPLPSLPPTRSCTPALHHGLTSSTTSSSNLGALVPPPIPTPPILPTQSLGSNVHHVSHGGMGGSSSMALRRHHRVQIQRRNRNPIYDSEEFAQYRVKQKEKDRQVWPETLEDAFVDALLLIVFMGRRKFFMRGKQHGRNMLFSEYIWLRWVASLEAGTPQPIKILNDKLPDDDPAKYNEWYRKRKQVSSHIQVLKGFFRLHWAYHFLFSKGKEEGSKDKNKKPAPNRWYQENTDQRSFKGDPVLTALEQNRLPTVRPNYEYFRQLLAMDKKVQVRPATCWIYVANSSLRDQSTLDEARGYKKDGSGALTKQEDCGAPAAASYTNPNPNNTVVNTYHATKGLLFREEFPHRYAFNNPAGLEDSPWTVREREVRNIRHTLLHEYTWPLKQTESSAVREVCDEWEADHPELHAMLQGVIDQHDLCNAHALPLGQLCDIIHVDVTLDIHRVRKLPEGSSFEWPFKINVAKEELQGHDWRVRTWLERPAELSWAKGGEAARGGIVSYHEEKGMMVEVLHARGCHDEHRCDCAARQRSSWLVPIPAETWAETMDRCARFPRYLVPKKRSAGRCKKEDDMPESDTVTQMDLMRGTAMFQELWSSAPPAPGSMAPSAWTRRAVILWTFNTIHFFDKDSNLCETPAGTSWRFLSAVDPLSTVHQERMLLSGGALSDRSGMSPTSSYQQLLQQQQQQQHSHQMADNLSSVWANGAAAAAAAAGGGHLGMVHGSAAPSMPVSPLASYGPSPLHVQSNFANGLVTPPPTAPLPSTYAFEGAPSVVGPADLGGAGHHQHHHHLAAYMPTSSMDVKASSSFVATDPFDADPYHLHAGAGTASFYEEDDDGSDTTLQGGEPGYGGGTHHHHHAHHNHHQWAAGLGSNGSAAVPLDWDHHGLQSLSMIAEEVATSGSNNTTENGHKTTTTTGSFHDDVAQHLQQHSYDPFAHLRAEARERRTQGTDGYLRHHELQRLHGNSRDDGRGGGSGMYVPPPDETTAGHGYAGQESSAASWSDEGMGQQQQHRGDGLSMAGGGNETTGGGRGLQDYGAGSLGSLLNRKRPRGEDDEEDVNGGGGNNRYSLNAMHRYTQQRDDAQYAPAAMIDRQDGGHSWS